LPKPYLIHPTAAPDTFLLELQDDYRLPYEWLTLKAWAIADTLGNTIAEGDTLRRKFLPWNPNANPELTLLDKTELSKEKKSGDIPFRYEIDDAEKDTVDISPRYSLDRGITWKVPSVTGDTLNIPYERYTGTLTWHSESDLESLDSRQLTSADSVWFRIVPRDKPILVGIVGIGDTVHVHVDNNLAPTDTITGSVYVTADSLWCISYELQDAEGDTLTMVPEYRRIDDPPTAWHRATVCGDTTALTPDKYRGTLDWLIERDLPLHAGTVLFRLTPHDLDAGTAALDTLWHNPYNAPVVSIITDFSTEQSDILWVEFRVEFEVPDVGRSVRIEAEYRFRNTEQDTSCYRSATIVGDTLVSAEEGLSWCIGWTSLVNAPGVDWDATFVRLIPYDAATGLRGVADSTYAHLDNNTPPDFVRLWTGPVMVRSDTIYYELKDSEKDTLDIDGWWSEDLANWSRMTLLESHTRITPDRYLGDLVWDSFIDVGYGDRDTVYVRLIPRDHDPGIADTTSFRLSNWAGDYDGDLRIDFNDFFTFVAAYNDEDSSKDIGPAEGTPPDLRPTLQEPIEIDIFDLAVFAQMRTWYLRNNPEAPAIILPPRAISSGDQHPVRLTQESVEDVWEEDRDTVTFRITIESVQGLMAAGIGMHYDPVALEFIEVLPGDFLGRSVGEKPNLFYLESADQDRGRIELMFGRLDRAEPVVEGNGLLATLRFRRLANGLSALDVAYDLRGRRTEVLAAGHFTGEVQKGVTPLRFTLHQNFPNPFNGETVIRFQLPTRERVHLYVLNVRGQRVATLLDQEMDPGFHQVRWSGADDTGRKVASGIYFYLIQAGSHVQSKKMILLK
jgi:hypothetical protein